MLRSGTNRNGLPALQQLDERSPAPISSAASPSAAAIVSFAGGAVTSDGRIGSTKDASPL
jgi:hypothetical protein